MAVELTYNDIKQAIYEALSEHDSEVARYGSAENKIRQETKDLTLKILNEIKDNFKKEKENDDKLLKEIKDGFNNVKSNNKNSSGFISSGGNDQGKESKSKTGSFIDSIGKKITRRLDKFGARLDLMQNNWFGKLMTNWNTAANEATQQVVDSMKLLNTSGVAQDWDQFREGLRDSTISLDTLNQSIQGHTQAFATLNKMSGNAVGTYQTLAKNAQDFASNQAHLAYDQNQTADALNAYLEMQRTTGNLDRLNEKEMSNGVNRLMKSADELAKEFGISRDALLKAAAGPDKDLDIMLQASGASADEIAQVKNQISALEQSGQTEKAAMLKELISTGGLSEKAFSLNAQVGSETLARAIEAAQQGNMALASKLITSEEFDKDMINWQNKQGKMAGTYNMFGDNAMKSAAAIAYQSRAAEQTRGGKGTKKEDTDETIVKEQKLRDEQQKVANNTLRIMTRSAENAGAMFDTMTTTLKGVNLALRNFGDGLTWLSNHLGGKWMGVLGAVMSGLGALSNLLTIFRTFNTLKNAGGVLNRLINFRKHSGKGLWNGIKNTFKKAPGAIKNVIKNAPKTIKNVIKNAPKTIKNVITKAPNAIKNTISKAPSIAKTAGKTILKGVGRVAGGLGLGIAGDVVHEYGSQALQSIGVGEKTATNVSNYAGSALKGAGVGAMIAGPVGAAIGAGVGVLAQGAKDLWDNYGDKIKKGIKGIGESISNFVKEGGITGAVTRGAKKLWDKYGEDIKSTVKNIGSKAWDFAKTAVTNPVEGLKKLTDIGKDIGSRIYEGAKGLLGKIGSWFGFGNDKKEDENKIEKTEKELQKEVETKEKMKNSWWNRFNPLNPVGSVVSLFSSNKDNEQLASTKGVDSLTGNSAITNTNGENTQLASAKEEFNKVKEEHNELLSKMINNNNINEMSSEADKDYNKYTSQIASSTNETNSLLEKLIYAVESNKKSNIG